MVRWLAIALVVSGCALPSKTEPFCYPKAKYERDHKRYYLGAKCFFQ